MTRPSEARRRLENVGSGARERLSVGPVLLLLQRVPPSVRAVGVGVLALYIGSALGLQIPGGGYIRSVFRDPYVFIAVRALAVAVLLALTAVSLWFSASVFAHIWNRLWVQRPAGFDAGALSRGAGFVEQGLDDVYLVLDETRDRNAELIAALDRANRRVTELEADNVQLRRHIDPNAQLSLENGS